MLIALITTIIIALLFGKITFKEIKGHVGKYTKKSSEEGCKEGKEDGDNGAEGTGTGKENSRTGREDH